MNLFIQIGNKRDPIYDSIPNNDDIWVDTVPLDVTDLAGHEKKRLSYQNKLLK